MSHELSPSSSRWSPSPSTTSSSDDSLDSSTSAISTSTNSSSSSFTRERRGMTRYAFPEFAPASSRSKRTPKYATEHVLIRARNANIPILLRHQNKKTNHAAVGRRGHISDDDSDYEQPHLQNQQRPKKQKVKSQEQLEAEERRMLERKAELADDPLLDASRMCPDKVWCLPCSKYIQIDSRRQFYGTLWYKHRGKRHGDVPLKRSDMDNVANMDVDMNEASINCTGKSSASRESESSVAFAVPVIDDAFATNILAEMYSKAKGLRLLSLAAAALA
ncbi:hypothetical protein DFJ43DRAFT_853141 [Lentinula guzmanii]|uniref:Uncharacterized protein n=1 Tax=Lentinula guzmanii TaxID=2804957 RepID=A0AA38JAQ4_9AGAR|nr:hypothetical protein DFJ43DRAFT_853141 [Lentinula guzmanii]